MQEIHDKFVTFARRVSKLVGSPWAFVVAISIIAVWAISGPMLGFSNTWQLVINSFTTIITFLMVFLIQNQQNRDSEAMELKLDEIIHSMKGARNKLIDLEEMSDEEMEKIQKEFRKMADRRTTVKKA